MIKTAEIKNFRGFSHAKITDCRTINLVVGDNGSGKTSLLEALFLAAGGSVEIALRLRDFRGYESRLAGSVVDTEEALWKDLFHKFDRESTISISLLGTEWRNRLVNIKFNDPGINVESFSKKSQKVDIETPPVITFEWIGPKGRRVVVKPVIRDGKINLPTVVPLPEETFFFASNFNYSAFETARRFSEVSKKFKTRDVIEKFKRHFPSVQDLTIELIGGLPMVCAALPEMPEKVPLNLISSGMSKLAAILFALASEPGSVALIDEIENGLHHQKLPDMWESLLDFCESSGSQIFASTHSDECLKAAVAVAEKHPEKFTVIQTDSKGRVFQFAGNRFVEAMNQSIELR